MRILTMSFRYSHLFFIDELMYLMGMFPYRYSGLTLAADQSLFSDTGSACSGVADLAPSPSKLTRQTDRLPLGYGTHVLKTETCL
jgi:hypothetical protein